MTLVHPDMTREFENICKILYSEHIIPDPSVGDSGPPRHDSWVWEHLEDPLLRAYIVTDLSAGYPGSPRHDSRVWEHLQDPLLRALSRRSLRGDHETILRSHLRDRHERLTDRQIDSSCLMSLSGPFLVDLILISLEIRFLRVGYSMD